MGDTTTPDTAATIAARLRDAAMALVEKETETDPVPAAIERMCRERSGKPVTKRDTDALEKAFPGLHVSLAKDHGVRIRYWTPVSIPSGRPGDDGDVTATGFTGERDAQGEPIYSKDLARRQIALYHAGVPSGANAYGIAIRSYWDAQTGGVTRWPSVDALREMNPTHYGARDERNACRANNRDAIATGKIDIDRLAILIHEMNLLAGELRGMLDDDAMPSELDRVVRDTLITAFKS